MELQVDANQNQMETETLIQAATWLPPDSPAATPTEPPILSLLKALLRRYLNWCGTWEAYTHYCCTCIEPATIIYKAYMKSGIWTNQNPTLRNLFSFWHNDKRQISLDENL